MGEASQRTVVSLCYCAALAGLGMILAALGPSLPALSRQTGAPVGDLSWLFTERSVGYLAGTYLITRFGDVVPGHALLAAALLAAGAATALIPAAATAVQLGLLSAAQGAGFTAASSISNSMLLRLHQGCEASADAWMQAMQFCFAAGAFAAPLALRWASAAGGGHTAAYRSFAAWLACSGAVVAAVPSAAAPEPGGAPPPETAGAGVPPAAAASDADAGAGAGDGAIVHAGGDGDDEEARERCVVVYAAAMLGMYVGGEVAFGGYVLLFAKQVQGQPESVGQLLTAVYWACIALGRLLAVPLSRRIAPQRLLAADAALALAAALVLAALPYSRAALWLVCVFFGLGMSSVFATAFSLADRYVDVTPARGGAMVTGASVGEMVFPTAVGCAMSAASPLVFAAAMPAFAAGIAAALRAVVARGARTAKCRGRGGSPVPVTPCASRTPNTHHLATSAVLRQESFMTAASEPDPETCSPARPPPRSAAAAATATGPQREREAAPLRAAASAERGVAAATGDAARRDVRYGGCGTA